MARSNGGRPGVRKARPWQGERPGSATARLPADEMLTVVAFDVPSDKVRRKLGEMCRDYGLTRLQWSVFEGPMTRNRREELWGRATPMLEEAPEGGHVAVYPIGEREAAHAQRFVTGGTTEKDGEAEGKKAAGGEG